MPAGDAADTDYRVTDAERERVVAGRRGRYRLGAWWLRVNGICIAIWVATVVGGGGHPYYFWPMWVLIGTTIPLLSAGRSRPRPYRDGTHHDSGIEAPSGPPEAEQPPAQRVLTTVLFVDIVESTRHAVAIGDAAWHKIVDSYQRAVHDELEACGGREVFTKGDEVVAAFPSAAGAVQCGRAVRDRARELDLELRIGVHAGEVDQQGHAMRGIAMHIGQRVCATAEPGQLLVSSTVRDLLVGSGLDFKDAGEHELKGLTGAWRLYALAD